MRDFIKKKGLWAGLIAIAIALFAAISAFSGLSSKDSLSGTANTVMGPFKRAAVAVVGVYEGIYDRMYKYDALLEEVESLRTQVAEYEREYSDLVSVTKERDELRDLLGFAERHEDYEYEPAMVSSWSASNWASAFIINKGEDDGLEIGDPVVNKDGYLIGKVTSLGETTATVTTVIDTKSSISAGIYTSTDPVVAQGNFELMGEGMLRLDYLPKAANIATGDAVFTWGGGGMPEGLILGYVEDVRLSISGLDDYAIVRTPVDYSIIENVYVITEYEVND